MLLKVLIPEDKGIFKSEHNKITNELWLTLYEFKDLILKKWEELLDIILV